MLLLLLFSCPVVSDSATPCTAARQASLSLAVSRSLLKFTPTALVMPSSRLILSRLPLLLPSISPSIGEFSHGSAVRIRWPKYWSFSFSISPSNKYSGLISLKIDWFDLLAVQGSFQGSPAAPQFEGIDSSAFCFLDYPALTALCDPQEGHSLDHMDLSRQSPVSAFQDAV